MDELLIHSINEDRTYVGHHYHYSWNRLLVMIEEQEPKINEEEKQDVQTISFTALNSTALLCFNS